jgi:hypothetical protein
MIRYFDTLIQGSDEWKAARCGLLTASEMKLVLTPTLKVANNDKSKRHFWQVLAQRITQYVPPSYINDDMLRGYDDEILARDLYTEKYAPVKEMGFITNDRFGFTLGCSPDGLVGDDGFIESKSKRQDHQVETIVECVYGDTIPDDHVMQVQTAFLVTERKWCDFISYSGGLPMATVRVYPNEKIMEAIENAAYAFEERIQIALAKYKSVLASDARLIPTIRRETQEMHL